MLSVRTGKTAAPEQVATIGNNLADQLWKRRSTYFTKFRVSKSRSLKTMSPHKAEIAQVDPEAAPEVKRESQPLEPVVRIANFLYIDSKIRARLTLDSKVFDTDDLFPEKESAKDASPVLARFHIDGEIIVARVNAIWWGLLSSKSTSSIMPVVRPIKKQAIWET